MVFISQLRILVHPSAGSPRYGNLKKSFFAAAIWSHTKSLLIKKKKTRHLNSIGCDHVAITEASSGPVSTDVVLYLADQRVSVPDAATRSGYKRMRWVNTVDSRRACGTTPAVFSTLANFLPPSRFYLSGSDKKVAASCLPVWCIRLAKFATQPVGGFPPTCSFISR